MIKQDLGYMYYKDGKAKVRRAIKICDYCSSEYETFYYSKSHKDYCKKCARKKKYKIGDIIKNGIILVEDKGMVNKKRRGIFECVCSNFFESSFDTLIQEKAIGCGCDLTNRNIKHKKRNTKLYNVWDAMKQRCYNKNNQRYSSYGGKGVYVCDEWVNDFKAFYDWAINNGYKKGLVLDKDIICLVKDVEPMYYSPDTCQFVTPSVSALVSKGKSKQYSQNAKDFICKIKNQE